MKSEAPLSAIVLAAGEGTRMRSTRPKPLHLLCGRAMVLYVLDSLADLALERAVVVVGHGAERVTKKLTEALPLRPGGASAGEPAGDGREAQPRRWHESAADLPLEFVEQHTQRGTGDAVSVALTAFPDDDVHDDQAAGDVLILPGDTPLLRADTITALVDGHRASGDAGTVLTAEAADPTGYGRVVRGRDGRVVRIVEQRDASPDELDITEWNTGVFCFRRSLLTPALRRVTPDNSQGEYYLTDVVEVLAAAGHPVGAVRCADPEEPQGINDRRQLASAEAELRRRTNDRWLGAGVTMVDPATTYIDATVRFAADVTVFPGVVLQGTTTVGEGAELGPGTRLVDCVVGARAVIDATVGREAEIGDDAVVGPFAVLSPGAVVAPGTRTGPHYASP